MPRQKLNHDDGPRQGTKGRRVQRDFSEDLWSYRLEDRIVCSQKADPADAQRVETGFDRGEKDARQNSQSVGIRVYSFKEEKIPNEKDK